MPVTFIICFAPVFFLIWPHLMYLLLFQHCYFPSLVCSNTLHWNGSTCHNYCMSPHVVGIALVDASSHNACSTRCFSSVGTHMFSYIFVWPILHFVLLTISNSMLSFRQFNLAFWGLWVSVCFAHDNTSYFTFIHQLNCVFCYFGHHCLAIYALIKCSFSLLFLSIYTQWISPIGDRSILWHFITLHYWLAIF